VANDPSWAAQVAVYDRLMECLPQTGQDKITIVDNMEAAEYEASLPFVLIGDDVVMDKSNTCGKAYEVHVFIACHAAGPARRATKLLAHEVRKAMCKHSEFVVAGFSKDPENSHVTTRSDHIEGVAHVATVEWVFELYDSTP